MDQSTFIGGLQDTRQELVSACRQLENLRRKMVGPRPEDSANAKVPPSEPNVASLISEIRTLSIEISKRVDEHLGLVGTDQIQAKSTGVAIGY
jgi:hypothetical protein